MSLVVIGGFPSSRYCVTAVVLEYWVPSYVRQRAYSDCVMLGVVVYWHVTAPLLYGDEYGPPVHTLLLLDATGAYHREIARQMSDKHMHYTTPMMQLQDAKQTKVLIATLAETTPVLEAANLQSDLRRAGIEPWAWIINNSVAAVQSSSPLLRQRAINELAQIDLVAHTHAVRYAVVPLIQDEPVGVERLRALANCHPVTA